MKILIALTIFIIGIGANCVGCLSGCSDFTCTGGCDISQDFLPYMDSLDTPCRHKALRIQFGALLYDNKLYDICPGSREHTSDGYCLDTIDSNLFVISFGVYKCIDSNMLIKDGNSCVSQ